MEKKENSEVKLIVDPEMDGLRFAIPTCEIKSTQTNQTRSGEQWENKLNEEMQKVTIVVVENGLGNSSSNPHLVFCVSLFDNILFSATDKEKKDLFLSFLQPVEKGSEFRPAFLHIEFYLVPHLAFGLTVASPNKHSISVFVQKLFRRFSF